MVNLEDNYRQKGLRRILIEELQKKGINSALVLEAMLNVPRHLFFDKAFEEWSYRDNAFPIGCEQTISQPYTVAFQTSLLELQPKDKILEIGLGSGYQACVLLEMGAKVYSIERHKDLYHKTVHRLKNMGYSGIRTVYGDGFLGLPRFAPFDKILITAAVEQVPEELILQLKPGGIMVLPLGSTHDAQVMTQVKKELDGKISQKQFGNFRFVPMLTGKV